MDFRALLRNRLDQNGWEVATIDDDTDWWVDQHWEVRSTRQANGLTLFLNLMVDRQHEGTHKSNAVWSITASTRLPAGRTDTTGQVAAMAMQKGRLDRNLNVFIGELNDYRNDRHRSQQAKHSG